jgi:hypothetical protein
MGHLLDFRSHFFKERPVKSKASLRALHNLWQALELPEDALNHARLYGVDPVLPSSFALGTAAQTFISAAANAAAEIWHLRGRQRQSINVTMQHAAQECRCYFTVDGVAPNLWDKTSGLYKCGDGAWIRVHANFAHHRDGILALAGCPTGPYTTREQFAQALSRWKALEFEDMAAQAGLVVAAMRTFDEWDAHPQRKL